MTEKTQIDSLIAAVWESKESEFYRSKWGSAGETLPVFAELPCCSAEDFIRTPLHDRVYKKDKGLAKIVRIYEKPFLVQWSLADLAAERFGFTDSARPLVMLSDAHEAIEKSLWFYEHDILPLIGEIHNVPVSAFAAKTYGIDAIVSDEYMLSRTLPELEKVYDLGKVASLTLIGAHFAAASIAYLRQFKNVQYILALPETGSFAASCPRALAEGKFCFHSDDGSYLELVGEHLVVTRLRLLVTPIIRYKTSIRAAQERCLCGREGYALL